MSEHNRQQNGDRLPLPSPRPSSGLDRKILDYARARAPEPARRVPTPWAAGLVTVAIVAVAVLIALPPQPAQELSRKAEQGSAAPSAPAPAKHFSEQRAQGPQMEAARELSSMADRAELPVTSRLAETPESAPAAAAATPARMVDEESLAARLAPVAGLLQAGDEAAAREAYRALRKSCPDCELPETLEQALARYSVQAPP